jgi:hypothetical protein
MISRIEGYLLIPHELLHVAGYWLVGKRCLYRWGNRYVTTIDPMTRNQELVGLLFPFAVCMMIWLTLLPVPFVALVFAGLKWAVGLSIPCSVPLIYAFTSISDLRRAYLLILNKSKDSPTPLDFFFWPVMQEHRKGLRNSSLAILICLVLITGLYYYLLLF